MRTTLGINLQTTLLKSCTFKGVGLHSGEDVTMTVTPSAVDSGILIKRVDVPLGDNIILARWDQVKQSPLCTFLVNGSGTSVSTVEHIMAALAGCGIHNAVIEVDGPEIPIMDGSAVTFVRAFLDAGLSEQSKPVRAIKILKPVRFETDHGWASLAPSDLPQMSFHIDFDDAAIGVQEKSMNLSNGSFVRELCDSRTFCRFSDVEYMRANGMALGGTFENAVVVDGDEVLSPGGLRHSDEAVRHKMLDALGDIALAGAPIIGHYTGYRAGHSMTNSLLRVLFTTPDAFEIVECDAKLAASLPGAGVKPEEILQVA